ncbi:MAG TPA: DUF697 domain-containing protein [Deinococcales bacterium]|nr:DUF697 domain-containing protein [Deinococcales bacterium]
MAVNALNLFDQAKDAFAFKPDPAKSPAENAQEAIAAAALVSAAVAAEPIPWLDLAVMLPLQVRMIASVGECYGFPMNLARARRVAVELGGGALLGFGARQALRELGKVVAPAVGGLITAPLAYAATFSLGHLAERYYRALRGEVPRFTPEERRRLSAELTEQGRKAAGSLDVKALASVAAGLRDRAGQRLAELRAPKPGSPEAAGNLPDRVDDGPGV